MAGSNFIMLHLAVSEWGKRANGVGGRYKLTCNLKTGECSNEWAWIAFLTQFGCRVTVFVTWQHQMPKTQVGTHFSCGELINQINERNCCKKKSNMTLYQPHSHACHIAQMKQMCFSPSLNVMTQQRPDNTRYEGHISTKHSQKFNFKWISFN